MYDYMHHNLNIPEQLRDAHQYVGSLDLKEYIAGFKKAKRASQKNWENEYYVCYYEKLDYVVPIAFQGCVALICDFDGKIINDIYNPSPEYLVKSINICVFPLEKESIIVMFVDDGDNRYRNFYKHFKKLHLEDRLATLTYIMFAYTEDVFFSKKILSEAKSSSELVNTSQITSTIISATPYADPYNKVLEVFDLSKRNSIPNLLSEKYKIN